MKFVKENFVGGLALSLPLILMYYWGFSGGGSSDANNNLWLGIMAIITLITLITLPGSVMLLILGFVAAFSGKSGELFVLLCLLLSVVNAQFMGMVYTNIFYRKKST